MEAHPLVGTWRLVSLEVRGSDGQVQYPYGPDATGYLMYSADGYMSAVVMSANRPSFAAGDSLPGALRSEQPLRQPKFHTLVPMRSMQARSCIMSR